MWRSCFALDKYARFSRTLSFRALYFVTMTKYLSIFISTLNSILSVINLSRLECAKTSCIRVHVINKTARKHLYSTEARVYSDLWLSSVTSDDSTSKLFDLALCFSLRRLVQVVFFRLNYYHFFFFRLNYHSDFYSSLKSLYVHQMIENHLINYWNFLTCLSVYSTFIVRVYHNLYLFLRFFFMSQRNCTRCAYNRLIHEFFNSNSTRVLNLCSSLFIDLPVYSYTLYASYMLHSTC